MLSEKASCLLLGWSFASPRENEIDASSCEVTQGRHCVLVDDADLICELVVLDFEEHG